MFKHFVRVTISAHWSSNESGIGSRGIGMPHTSDDVSTLAKPPTTNRISATTPDTTTCKLFGLGIILFRQGCFVSLFAFSSTHISYTTVLERARARFYRQPSSKTKTKTITTHNQNQEQQTPT